MGTELLINDPFNAAVVFNNEEKAAETIARVKELAEKALVLNGATADATTAEGRAVIRSVAHKITKSKTFVEAERKSYTADLVKKKRAVDSIGNTIWDALEKLSDEIRKPLTDWEDKDKARMEAHDAAIAAMQALTQFGPEPTPTAVREHLAALVVLRGRVWEEFINRAVEVANTVEGQLNAALAAAEKRERDAAELAAFRAKEAERAAAEAAEKARRDAADLARAEAERAAAIAAEAAQRAKTEAEAAARREIDEANARAEQLVREAEEVARRAEEAAARAEQERLAAAARAEREKQEAVAAAERRAAEEAAALKRQQDAERAAEEARRAAEEAAEQQRKANTEHRSKINRVAKNAISSLMHDADHLALTTEDCNALAQEIVVAIIRGQIPNVAITY